MKIIQFTCAILTFINVFLIFWIVFFMINFLLLRGEEKTGIIVTAITIGVLLLNIIISLYISNKVYLNIQKKTTNANVIFLISLMLLMIIIISSLSLPTYFLVP
jgi:hypothetical protein